MEIYSEPINKEIEESLISGKLDLLWEVVSSLEGDSEFEDKKNAIKYGIDILFDIRAITEGKYEEKVAFRTVWIERKQIVNLTKFRDEMDKRITLMKEILRSLPCRS